MTTPHTSALTLRLTALWALCEAGLGGILHTFQLPLKGMVLSCFSVMSIALIAWYNPDPRDRNAAIWRAWAVVLALKFALSPQSPPTAYLAITFQALCSIACFRLIPNFKTACLVTAVLCLLETALQRVLIVSAVVGFDFLQGKSQWAGSVIADQIVLKAAKSSVFLMTVYVALHGLAGLWAGWTAGRLPQKIEAEKRWLSQLDPFPVLEKKEKKEKKKKRKQPKKAKDPYRFPTLIAGWANVLLLTGHVGAGAALLKGAVLWTIFLTPFVQTELVGWTQWLVHWATSKHRPDVADTSKHLPELRLSAQLAWQIAGKEEKRLPKRVVRFVPLLFALGLPDEYLASAEMLQAEQAITSLTT